MINARPISKVPYFVLQIQSASKRIGIKLAIDIFLFQKLIS